jgi:preprotein translocase subunit SecA
VASARWGDRWRRLVGQPVAYDLGSYEGRLGRIHEARRALASLPDAGLTDRARALRVLARAGAPLGDLVPELFALVHECAQRTLGLTPYDEQLIAGLAMSEGKVAEMQTGEGKTLAAVAPVALFALGGAGAHVLTFNDYLARRDAGWMGPIYRLLGLEVAHVEQGMTLSERREAYGADVTYLTAKEAGFDFLRDNLCLETGELAQRPFHFALVDEADSILIDEARIPLVIASQDHAAAGPASGQIAELVKGLVRGEDFDTDDQARNIALTDRGARRLEEALGCGNLYETHNLELLADARNALHAQHLLKCDVDYIVRDGRVELVDDFTGRVAERRQWPDGLQAAIEAKERVELKAEGRILGSITMQHFVANYPYLCGMTATARPAAEELEAFYGLSVAVIPTHRPGRREDHADAVFTHQAAKRRAVVDEIVEVHASGQPVLVGTASVRESEELAAELSRAGVEARVLNAKNDAAEAAIVAEAGAPGAVTISTNMAGRGTDIRLGGPRETHRQKVCELGGLYVIGTNRHASLRVDQQLRGRSARQGDPGSTRFFVSLEDPLIETYGVRGLIPEDRLPAPRPEAIGDPLVAHEIARAQRIIEGASFDIRKRLWRYSRLIEDQRRAIHSWRRAVLTDEGGGEAEASEEDDDDETEGAAGVLEERAGERWAELVARLGAEECRRLERRLTLLAIDRVWSDHLALARRIRDNIHVVSFAGKEPLAEYTREVGQAFADLRDLVDDEMVARFQAVEVTEDGIDWGQAGLLGPTSTWTYLIHDDPFGQNAMLGFLNRRTTAMAGAAFVAPLLVLWGLVLHYKKRLKRSAISSAVYADAPPGSEPLDRAAGRGDGRPGG